jgi:hypothetical protein
MRYLICTAYVFVIDESGRAAGKLNGCNALWEWSPNAMGTEAENAAPARIEICDRCGVVARSCGVGSTGTGASAKDSA